MMSERWIIRIGSCGRVDGKGGHTKDYNQQETRLQEDYKSTLHFPRSALRLYRIFIEE